SVIRRVRATAIPIQSKEPNPPSRIILTERSTPGWLIPTYNGKYPLSTTSGLILDCSITDSVGRLIILTKYQRIFCSKSHPPTLYSLPTDTGQISRIWKSGTTGSNSPWSIKTILRELSGTALVEIFPIQAIPSRSLRTKSSPRELLRVLVKLERPSTGTSMENRSGRFL